MQLNTGLWVQLPQTGIAQSRIFATAPAQMNKHILVGFFVENIIDKRKTKARVVLRQTRFGKISFLPPSNYFNC